MELIDWAVKIATAIGLTIFVVCAFIGAQSLIAAWRITLEIWKAKRRYHAIRSSSPEFQKYTDKNDV